MARYWVPHEELAFAPCWLESKGAKDAVLLDPEEKQVTYPSAKLDSLAKVLEPQLLGVDNICSLEEVSEAALLHAVRVRYGREQVYTRVARILIAVNPFKALPIYSAQHLEKYLRGADSMELAPHVYGIGLDAISGLRKGDGRNQAVLISGESGAGKTESTKLVLSYIAEALGGTEGGIQDKIMRTNPVLEAFGNAMTVRNNNSSRFGKWLQIMVSAGLKVQGCAVVDYLLELTRVCSQGEKERNYHIFFQLIEAKNEDVLKGIKIGEPQDYQYLQGAQFKAPGIDDGRCFEELKDAFDGLGYSQKVQTEVFRVVIGILAIGNVNFTEQGDAARVANEDALERAAELLGIGKEELRSPLVIRKITVGKDVTQARRNATQAKAVRDGLARLLYGRLFKWLIAGINNELSEGGSLDGQFFGVLDIAGFESFEVNSLEQLFINLSNEHLQLHFNTHIFKMELDDYRAEGVPLDSTITFKDNSDIVQLLDSKGAILSILDEEVTMPKATDQTFLSKVFKAHEKHPRLVKPKFAGAMKFGIRHFAGEVTYAVEGFLEKNVDRPPDDAPTLLQASSLSVLQEVGSKIAAEVAEASGGARGKKVKTVSSGFRASLASLVGLLNRAEPHFIRCVKPNVEKVPAKFTAKLVMEQLLSSGVFEAVHIRQSGYASRVAFKEFLGRFKVVAPQALQQKIFARKTDDDDLDCVKGFLEALPSILSVAGGDASAGGLVLGKTKVFAKAAAMSGLERSRDLAISGNAVEIQRRWRGYETRKKLKGVKMVFLDIAAWGERNNFYSAAGSKHTATAALKTYTAIEAEVQKLNALFEKAERLPLEVPRRAKIEKVRSRMESEAKALKQLQVVAKSTEPTEIERALSRARDLDLAGDLAGYSEVDALVLRVQRLKVQIPLVKAMTDAMATDDTEQLQEVLEKIKSENLHTRPEDWVEELNGQEIAGSVYQKLDSLKAKQKLDSIERTRKEELQKQLEETTTKNQAVFEATPTKEEPPQEEKAKKRRTTITGFSEEEQEQVKLRLLAACHEYDADELEHNLAEATRQGMEPCGPLEKAQELFEQLQTEAFLIATMKERRAEVRDRETTMQALKCLQNLVAQAMRLGVAEEAAAEARAEMQAGVRQRVRSTIRGSILHKVDVEEFGLVEGAFKDLANFAGMKSAAQWKGHRAVSLFQSGGRGEEVMLRHAKTELCEALTKVPPVLEKKAVLAFRNILGWMSDRPMPECQRLGYAQDVVEAARSDRALGDEIFVQVMKQLTDNPSKRSSLLGWKLMLLLCQQASPSRELDDFVHTFLLRATRDGGCHEAEAIAKQCISDLNINTSPEKFNSDDDDVVPVQVLLIDHSTRKILAPQGSTLEQLGERMAQQLRISNAKDFGFFQLTEALEMHRLLPDTTVLSTLTQKWAKLKEATGRASRLLYKRRFIRLDERLDPGDLMHATLTFRQAIWDYIHYPISEEVSFICETAAHILSLEHDHFKLYIDTAKLHEPGILEQLIPAISMHEQKRYNWGMQVLAKFHELFGPKPQEESRLAKMSRTLTLLQKMRLFGAYCWLGRQTMTVPSDKVSIPQAPQQMYKINNKAPESEYWICVDLFGVRFVSVDSTPGKGYQRGFVFNEEYVERLLGCCAKHNYVQFVVCGRNPSNPAAGRVPMTIALISPAAVDIAFTVHTIQRIAQGS